MTKAEQRAHDAGAAAESAGQPVTACRYKRVHLRRIWIAAWNANFMQRSAARLTPEQRQQSLALISKLKALLLILLIPVLTSCATNSAGQTWLRWWLLHGD